CCPCIRHVRCAPPRIRCCCSRPARRSCAADGASPGPVTSAPPPAGAPAAGPAPTGAGRFRPELHGLRGLAIGLVVLYHVWFDRVSGGVDVFLFLSSFLLVGTFLRRVDAGRPTAPAAYWGRTFKRLLPPTAPCGAAVRTPASRGRWRVGAPAARRGAAPGAVGAMAAALSLWGSGSSRRPRPRAGGPALLPGAAAAPGGDVLLGDEHQD